MDCILRHPLTKKAQWLNYPFLVILPHIINPVQPMTMKANSNHFSTSIELMPNFNTCHHDQSSIPLGNNLWGARIDKEFKTY